MKNGPRSRAVLSCHPPPFGYSMGEYRKATISLFPGVIVASKRDRPLAGTVTSTSFDATGCPAPFRNSTFIETFLSAVPVFWIVPLLVLLVSAGASRHPSSQFGISTEELRIRATVMDYVEGIYDRDADRMARSLHPDVRRQHIGQGVLLARPHQAAVEEHSHVLAHIAPLDPEATQDLLAQAGRVDEAIAALQTAAEFPAEKLAAIRRVVALLRETGILCVYGSGFGLPQVDPGPDHRGHAGVAWRPDAQIRPTVVSQPWPDQGTPPPSRNSLKRSNRRSGKRPGTPRGRAS